MNVRIALVRLDQRTAEVVTPEGDYFALESAGAALNLTLIERYGRESLVFGSGPLTGTLAPASALLVGSFLPGAAEAKPVPAAQPASFRHVPLLLTAGPDFRCSGIDHLVLLGTAEQPTLLHIDGGRVRFADLPKRAADLSSLEKELRRSSPPFRSAILTSSAADANVPFAAVSIDTKGSLDKAGLAGAMAAKNLKGILLGGSGGIGFAAEDLRRSLELVEKIKRDKRKADGFASVMEAAGGGDGLKSLKGAKLRAASCFHCPAPCMVHARFAAADPSLPLGPKRQNGLLLLDHQGFMAVAQKRPGTALPLFAESVRLGLDPCAAAPFLPAEGGKETLASDFAVLSDLTRGSGPSPTLTVTSAAADLSFGGSPLLPATGKEARRRTALAFVLGVCPLFLQRFPQVVGDLQAFLPAGVEQACLERSTERVLAQG